jgi:hypothetical protein
MGVSGSVSISSLKTATGIVSNDLFDHAPGTPNKVKMSDFFTTAIGRDIDGDYDNNTVTDGSGNVPAWDTNLSVPNGNTVTGVSAFGTRDGSLNSSGTFKISTGDNLGPGQQFWVRVNFGGKDFAFQQIIPGSLTVTSTTNCDVKDRQQGNAPNGNSVVDFKLEVTGYDTLAIDFEYNDGGYNSDAINYNTTLGFFTDDVKTPTPYLQRVDLTWASEQINSQYVACDGSTSLDQLAATADGYGVKVDVTISDPTNQNAEYWLWIYFDDSGKWPPDNSDHNGVGDGGVGDPVEGKGACANTRTGAIIENNNYNMYVYITLDQSGSNVFADDFITFTPSKGNEGSTSKTFSAP